MDSRPPTRHAPPAGEVALIRFSRPAMATTFGVQLPYGLFPELNQPAAEAALDLIDRVERRITVYRGDSEVCRLNAAAGRGWVTVSPSLMRLLIQSLALSRDTGGAFDPAAGALVKAWGFYRRRGQVPSGPDRLAAMARVGMKHVMLDEAGRRVRFRREGLELNFGAIGKGYALDRAARLLRQRYRFRRALLHSGASSALALGTPGAGHAGWRVAVRHPEDGRCVAEVLLNNRAMATSAATYQFFEHQGRRLGHILDPRTGWPADTGIAQVSAFAPTAAEADALATAFYAMGIDGTEDYCRTHPRAAALIIPAADGRPVTLNLPPAECRLTP